MKPAFESVATEGNSSFVVRRFEEKHFSAPYHFHPELEITLILNGSGKRYVGSHMQDYFAGDLVLLGSGLPHCWKTADASKENSVSLVIHFNMDFLGRDFFHRPEMSAALRLLNKGTYGLQFKGDTAEVKKMMLSLPGERDSCKKLIVFLEILHKLSTHKNCVRLNKQSFYVELSQNDKQRINEVIAYVVDNFQNAISLNEAASIANMTTHAFCKYFKRVTRKTFLEAVNDYRIDFATKQLINTDKPVSEIGFESGFNDASNFYKTFKRRIQLSPLGYRNMFIKKMGE